MPLTDHIVIFIDCQTTSPNPTNGNLLEISWSLGNASGERFNEQSYLIKQPDDKPVPYRIKSITGISDADMEVAIPIEEARLRLLDTISCLPEPRYCIAHFARFELPFLLSLLNGSAGSSDILAGAETGECGEFKQVAQSFLCKTSALPPESETQTQIKEELEQASTAQLPFELLCTFEIAKRLYPNLPSKGIRAVAGFFGTTCGELKRATAHVDATLSIWRGLAPLLKDSGIEDISQLSDWFKATPKPKRTKYEYPLPKEKRLTLPDVPGVYRMLSRNNNILYVGKATSLKQRVNSYFRGQRGKDSKTKELISQVFDILVTACSSPLEAALLETDEIKKWNPPYNRALKRGERELVFYSTDFSSSDHVQSEHHPIGPFANSRVLEPIQKLFESIKNNKYDSEIFFSQIPEVLLAEGFELFCIDEAVERDAIKDARSLLALGIWLYRKRNLEKRRDELLEAEISSIEPIDGIDSKILQDPQQSEDTQQGHDLQNGENLSQHSRDSSELLTPQAVSDKFGRMLRRVAHAYLRSKLLTNLLSAEVHLEHRDIQSRFLVNEGQIDFAPTTQKFESFSETPWLGLGIDTYDRMSVLLTELSRNDNVSALTKYAFPGHFRTTKRLARKDVSTSI